MAKSEVVFGVARARRNAFDGDANAGVIRRNSVGLVSACARRRECRLC